MNDKFEPILNLYMFIVSGLFHEILQGFIVWIHQEAGGGSPHIYTSWTNQQSTCGHDSSYPVMGVEDLEKIINVSINPLLGHAIQPGSSGILIW